MPRNIRWNESVRENALNLVEALLYQADDELDDLELKAAVHVEWLTENRLRVTGKEKQTRRKREQIVEVGTRKEHLLKLVNKTGKSLKLPKPKDEASSSQQERELEEVQTVLDCLKELDLRKDEKSRKNQGYWRFTLTLKHQTATREENLGVVQQKWQEHPKTNSLVTSSTTPILEIENSIDWREVCRTMLEKQKRLTTNELLSADEDMKFELDEIHVPLALMQRTKPDKRSQDEGNSPEEGSRLYEPTYEKKQRFQHEEFLAQVLKEGKGQSKGRRIALIGEPGAGKTTLLQSIAFWLLEDKNQDLGLPIWVSLADLQGKTLEEYLRQRWLKNALSVVRVTPEQENALLELFKNNRVWLLLDGVDEIVAGSVGVETQGIAPLQMIASHLEGWVRQARVMLSCRLNVWEANLNALENFETYRLLDFDYPGQVKELICRWFAKTDADKGERLWVQLDKSEHQRIQDLVKNPLRLALLCSTWQSSSQGLPSTKAGLYQRFLQEFYKWKENRFPTTEDQQAELNAALGRLAKRAIDQEVSRFRLRHQLVREELGDPKQRGSLFWLALQLGWLNQVGLAAESETQEKVYAFFHPTFQEYFAALAVEDWDFFLPRAHDNHNPKPVSERYRIFEPQWKEVILLWLGREEVAKKQKDAFINALLEFDDGCRGINNFYRYRVCFLAASGTAEFRNCNCADAIVGRIVKWGFGYFNREKQKWQRLARSIEHEARKVLQESDRSLTINKLIELMRSVYAMQNQEPYRQAVGFLGQIGTGNSLAINALTELLQISKNEDVRQQTAESLGLIDPGNLTSITALIDFLYTSRERTTFQAAIDSLGKIGVGNLDAINTLSNLLDCIVNVLLFHDPSDNIPIYLRENSLDIGIFYSTIKSLRKAISNPTEVINLLVELLNLCRWDYICLITAKELLDIAPDNQDAINSLINLSSSGNEPDIRLEAVCHLGKNQFHISDISNILIEILNSNNDFDTNLKAATVLNEVDPTNPTLTTILAPDEDEEIRVQAAENLLRTNPRNQDAIDVLIYLLNASRLYVRWKAADLLGAMAIGNSDVIINTLINLLQNDQEQNQGNTHHTLSAQSLKRLIQKQHFPLVVISLKNCLQNQLHRYEYIGTIRYCCYDVMWHCAQNMTYPAFYQAWHQQEGVEKTTTPDSQSLNQADLPQSLDSVIAIAPQLSQTIHLICIDGSQFIERDRPVAEIYDQMLDQNCPECDTVPETMPALKLYWNALKRNSNKQPVLVFYASSTDPYSEAFLTALSKFGGAICVVTSPPTPSSLKPRLQREGSKSSSGSPSSSQGEGARGWGSLQLFAPSQAIADVVEWIREKV